MEYYILSKIAAKRLEKNFSQQYMATSLKITQGYYNKLENGKIEMTIRIMFEILEILEMDISELFGNINTSKKHNNHN